MMLGKHVTFFLLCTLLLFFPFGAVAQERGLSWESFAEHYAPLLIQGEDDDPLASEAQALWWQRMEELARQPLNLNRATRRALLELPFLSTAQTDSILLYRTRHRAFVSLGELQLIPELDYQTRQLLSLFTFVGDTLQTRPSFFKGLTTGTHRLESLLDIPFYRRAGEAKRSTSELAEKPNAFYLGRGWAHTLRYRYSDATQWAYGITLQKDAGEPFATEGNYPYDYTSAFVHFRDYKSRYEVLLGDFRVRTGQGLVFGDGFLNAPTFLLDAPHRAVSTLRPHTGSEENKFFRGVATRLSLRQSEWLFFASVRRLDALRKGDSVQSLQTSGYHRTPTELARKDVLTNLSVGARFTHHFQRVALGVNAFYTHYALPLAPVSRPYTTHYFRGRHAGGFSLDWAWQTKQLSLYGEVASDAKAHLALSQTLVWTPQNALKLVLQHRHLAPAFYAPFGSTVQTGSRNANEHGAFLALQWKLAARWQWRNAVDVFYFPQPTFSASLPSHGFKLRSELRFLPSRHWTYVARYDMTTRQRNVSGYKELLEYVQKHRMRLQTQGNWGRNSLSASLDAALSKKQTAAASLGWAASARFTHTISPSLRLKAFTALFFTDDFASSIYAYEPQLRHDFAFSSFYYKGFRAAALAEWKIWRKFELGLKYSLLHYFNRRSISSAAAAIASREKHDLVLRLHYSF